MSTKPRQTILSKHQIPIYNFDLFVVFSDDLNDGLAQTEIQEIFGKQENRFASEACSITNGGGHYGLFFTYNFLSNGIISHECYHLLNYINRNIGHKADKSNDEPSAYLLSHITDIVYKLIKKHKLKIVDKFV